MICNCSPSCGLLIPSLCFIKQGLVSLILITVVLLFVAGDCAVCLPTPQERVALLWRTSCPAKRHTEEFSVWSWAHTLWSRVLTFGCWTEGKSGKWRVATSQIRRTWGMQIQLSVSTSCFQLRHDLNLSDFCKSWVFCICLWSKIARVRLDFYALLKEEYSKVSVLYYSGSYNYLYPITCCQN
jgi:hypothetical protein